MLFLFIDNFILIIVNVFEFKLIKMYMGTLMEKYKFIGCGFVFACAMSVPIVAMSQEDVGTGEAGEARKNRSRLMLEEVIVKAQHREENIKDVPIAISAFGAEQLEAKGVYSQVDLPKITPGLNFTSSIGLPAIYLRGIGTDGTILADPLVVSYVDGVYFPDARAQFQSFGTIEKVEVSKGPQGTLFGRNALGGVIAITSKDPDLNEVYGGLTLSQEIFTGNDSDRGAEAVTAYISVPVSDTFAVLVSGASSWTDPYWNIYNGPANNRKLVDDGYSWSYRIKTLWDPTDRWSVRLNYYEYFTDDDQRNFSVNSDPSALLASVGQTNTVANPQDPRDGEVNEIMRSREWAQVYFGKIEYQPDWGVFELLGSYQTTNADRNYDFDSTPLPVAVFDGVDEDGVKGPFFNDNLSAELRFLTNETAPEWFEGVFGLYYYEQEFGIHGATFGVTGSDVSQGIVGGVGVPLLTPSYNTLRPLLIEAVGVDLIPQIGPTIGFGGQISNESWSAYSQMTFSFTDWLSLTLGLRYTEDYRWVERADQFLFINERNPIHTFHYSGEGGEGPVANALINDAGNPEWRSETQNLDPKIVLSYQPSDSFLGDEPLVYASYSEASNGDTFNVIGMLSSPQMARGSSIKAYELGMKTTVGPAALEGAVFFYEEADPQSQVVSLQSGGAVHFENAELLEVRGAELAVLTPLFPKLTNYGLVGTLSASYLDTEYTSYKSATSFDPDTGLKTTSDVTGNRVVQTPELTYTASLSYTIDLPGGPLEIGADYYYNDGFWFSPQNDDNSRVESYDLIGFNMSYLYEKWQTRFTVYGRNVGNSYYEAGIFPNDFGTTKVAAPGAMWGAKFGWEF